MKKTLFMGIAVAFLFSACEYKNLPEIIADGTLKGTIEQPVVDGFGEQTRAGFGQSFAFNWQTGDKIMVLTSAGSKAFTLSSGAGTATGTFVGSLESGMTVSNKVASPYKSGNTLSATSTSMTLPAEYNYGSNTTFTTIPVTLPCWAPIEANAFSMSHLVGYLAFEISNIPAGANKFVLTTENKRINGVFTADLTAETPIFAAVDAANDAEKAVTINFTTSAEVTTHCFVVPIPVGTYTYDWYIKADETLKGFGNGENIAVGRAQIKGCRVACAEIGGGEPEPDPYNGHEYVDLGLPSGLKWASMHIGATAPEDYGDFFAWGDTQGHVPANYDFQWSNYILCGSSETTMNKYCNDSNYGVVDNKTVLDPEDDAAHVIWGGNWRMPTNEELTELRTNCTWTWEKLNGVMVFKGQSTNNDNCIFFPCGGMANGWGISGSYNSFNCWSSTVVYDESYEAHTFGGNAFNGANRIQIGNFRLERYIGLPIRPVCD